MAADGQVFGKRSVNLAVIGICGLYGYCTSPDNETLIVAVFQDILP